MERIAHAIELAKMTLACSRCRASSSFQGVYAIQTMNSPEMKPRMAEKVLSILALVPIEFNSIHSDRMFFICQAMNDSSSPVRVNPIVKKGLEAGLVSVSEINGMYGSQPSKVHVA